MSASPTIDRDPKLAPQPVVPQHRLSQSRATEPIGKRLLDAGLLREEQLESALAHQKADADRQRGRQGVENGKAARAGKPLGEIIAELGLVDEADLLPMLGAQLGVDGVRLREGLIDPKVIQMVPREVSEQLNVLPLMKVGDELTVAMADPLDLAAIDRLGRISGCRIRAVFTLASGIERLLPRCYEDDFAVDTDTADMDVEQLELDSDAIDLDLDDAAQLADGSPVINLVNYAIIQAVRQGASDVHIEPGVKNTSVRFRIDGLLREAMKPKKELHAAIISRIKVMAKLDIAEHRQPQDGRLHVRLARRDIDLRISTLPTVLGEKVVMRVLDRQSVTFDLSRLGLPDSSYSTMRRMLARPHGLVLVTGPTGSGKTTTLYSAIELIKGIERNVITVEDPVEYQLELINQVQVQNEIGITFAGALRSILRQDPDVIMVGEIRDRETAETAIQAALTGHLVLSTLHTNDAASAVTRLVDMGVESFKISAALVGVIAQRLVRNLCTNCCESYYPTATTLQEVGYQGNSRQAFARPRGCSQCFESGYRGRSGIYEVLEIDQHVGRLISDRATLAELKAACKGPTLKSAGLQLAEQAVTSLEEIARVTADD
ncbi:MAG: ATPase, T2SS/T4P/T4SS family [Planctomycetota bacterium]